MTDYLKDAAKQFFEEGWRADDIDKLAEEYSMLEEDVEDLEYYLRELEDGNV